MCIATATAIGTALGSAIGISMGSTAAAVTGYTAITLGVAAVGAAAVGGAMGIVSDVERIDAQKEQAKAQARIAEENSRLARRQAERTELAANQKRRALLIEAQQKTGAARTAYAAGNVVLGQGSSAEVEADIRNAYDLDLRNFNYDVENEKWAHRVEGVSQANNARYLWASAEDLEASKGSTIFGGVMKTVASTASTALTVGQGLSGLAKSGTSLLKAAPKVTTIATGNPLMPLVPFPM